jgi:hypothetical protein
MSRLGDVDVFISYTQSDYAKYAEPLARYLRDAGMETWIAPERLALGDEYPQELTRAIEACSCLVVIVSQAVAQSKHVPREVTMALEANKRLIGIKVDPGQVPENVRYCLATCHLLDASTGPFEACVQRVIDQLRQHSSAKMTEVPQATVNEGLGMTQVVSELVALWRKVPESADVLEFRAPEGREFEDGSLHKRIAFSTSLDSLTLGRRELAHKTVSRRAVSLRRENGRVWLKRDDECSAAVSVGLEPLEAGQERLMIHDRPVVIGRVEGRFVDHRYRPVSLAPVIINGRAESLVDERTGLLSRAGILRELAHSERKRQQSALILLKRDSDDEEYACQLALALHADNPNMAVARWDQIAALLAYGSESCLNRAQQIAGDAPLRVGQLSVSTGNGSVLTLLADASAALERVTPAAAPYRIVDLREHWLSLREPAQFVGEVERARFADLGIVAIEEFGRLTQLDPAAAERLERELLLDLSHELGTETVFSRIVPGVVAFAGNQRAERVARLVASHWRERGPVQGPVFEVECQLAFETIPIKALTSLVTRAKELGSAVAEGITAQGLPYPIALHAHAALEETGSEAALAAAKRFREATEQFVYIVLCALYAVQTDATAPDRRYTTWRELGESVVPRMCERTDRIGEFARSLAEPTGKLQTELVDALLSLDGLIQSANGHVDLEKLRTVMKQALVALKGLRRWTLATIERFERVDPFSDRKSLQYVDHTGPSHSGIRRQVTLVRDIPLGPFVYLVRLPDAVAFPLEPFVRRRLCAAAQEHQLLIARQPFYAAGEYQFVSPQGFEQQDHVDSRQLPRSLRVG